MTKVYQEGKLNIIRVCENRKIDSIPIEDDTIEFHIYSNGKIVYKKSNNTFSKASYKYYDANNTVYALGTYNLIKIKDNYGGFYKDKILKGDFTYLIDVNNVKSYSKNGIHFGFTNDSNRPYINYAALGGIFGAMIQCGFDDFVCNGFSKVDGSPGVSTSHKNGFNGDFKYLRKDKLVMKGPGTSLDISLSPHLLDPERQNQWIDALYLFGWKAFLGWTYTLNGKTYHLNHIPKNYSDHNHHLHAQQYTPNLQKPNNMIILICLFFALSCNTSQKGTILPKKQGFLEFYKGLQVKSSWFNPDKQIVSNILHPENPYWPRPNEKLYGYNQKKGIYEEGHFFQPIYKFQIDSTYLISYQWINFEKDNNNGTTVVDLYAYDANGNKLDSLNVYSNFSAEGEGSIKKLNRVEKNVFFTQRCSVSYVAYNHHGEIKDEKAKPEFSNCTEETFTLSPQRFQAQHSSNASISSNNFSGVYTNEVCLLSNSDNSICFDYELRIAEDSIIFLRNGFQVHDKILCTAERLDNDKLLLRPKTVLIGNKKSFPQDKPLLTVKLENKQYLIKSDLVVDEENHKNTWRAFERK